MWNIECARHYRLCPALLCAALRWLALVEFTDRCVITVYEQCNYTICGNGFMFLHFSLLLQLITKRFFRVNLWEVRSVVSEEDSRTECVITE